MMENPTPPKFKTTEEIVKSYQSPPWWYNFRIFFVLNGAYRNSLLWHIVFFARNMGPDHLEVAVGSGILLKLILLWRAIRGEPKVRITAIDLAESMLAGAIKSFQKETNMSFQHQDVVRMDFADNRFDTINVANAVHCFSDVDKALTEMYRVLKPGGTLAANVLLFPRSGGLFCKVMSQRINQWGMNKGVLFTPYERDDIRSRFIKVGFIIELEKVMGNCYMIVVRKSKF